MTGVQVGNARLVSALGYAKRGWPVFPCRQNSKKPATKHGFKDGTTDRATIVRWWADDPFANVAIATGGCSGLVVGDIDRRSGGHHRLRELEAKYGKIPETLGCSTGDGGHHLYLGLPPGTFIRSGKLVEGIDLKADGGYVIAPPSVHPNGQPYEWDHDPNRTEIAQCPEWILLLASHLVGTEPSSPSEQPSSTDAATSPLGKSFAERGMLGRALEGGKRAVVCPWHEQHTTGAPFDSSTVVFPPNAPDGLGGFHCSHAHCQGRTSVDALRELQRRSGAGALEPSWMTELHRTAKGHVKSSFGNLVRILAHDPKYAGSLRLDEMRGVVLLEKTELTDANIGSIRVDLEDRYGIQPSDAEAARAVQLGAAEQAFHPVREFLSGLTWDGTRRLDFVTRDVLRVRADNDEEAALLSLLVRRWFLCLVARPFMPGCKVDTALILQGAQGAGKSTFFRIIGGEWFSDTEMALDKDALMQLRGAWIYEWAELENVMGRHAVSRVKAFLTSTEDKFRPPFGRMPITVRRSGVIVGTTNNEDFLHDPTGSRRFWIVPVGRIDADRLRADRDQILAEAVAAHRAGERRWLDEAEEAKREGLAERFVESDPWDERVLAFATLQEVVRTSDVLLQALGVSIDKLTRRDEMRVANILRRSGYAPRQVRVQGRPTRVWRSSQGE